MKEMWRIIKLAGRLEPLLLPAMAVETAIDSLTPYIDTLLGAWVLDRLVAGAGLAAIIPTVVKVLLLRLVLRFVFEIAQQIDNGHANHLKDMFLAMRCEKTLSMDYEELNSPAVNKLRDRVNTDDMHGWNIVNVTERIFMVIFGQLASMITAAVIIVPMVSLSPASVAYLVITALASVGMAMLRGKFREKNRKLVDSYENARSHSSYYLWGNGVDYKMGKDIRVYHAQPMIEKAVAADKEERESRLKYKRFDRRTSAFGSGFTGLLQGTSYVYVILRAVGGALSAGQVVKFASSIYSFWSSFSTFVSQWAMLKADCKRMEDTLSFMALDDGKTGGHRPVPEGGDMTFEFRDVSFTYPGGGSPALNHISCTLKQGERVAVVGLNGSGKTTFIKLLCRLYHPGEGEILLNGVNIEEFELKEYMRLLSVVFQDFALFPFTLGENVASAEEYDGEKADSALETAGFGDRLQTLEKGLGTVLYKDYDDGGMDVSGGEAQKIALARALYKDSPFMVLDEPTAALDPVAEYEIYTRFNGFTSGKGAVYISHRLSSCVFCDRIMVFEDGKIVQTGGHRELVAADGLYSRLWNAQAQYYKS